MAWIPAEEDRDDVEKFGEDMLNQNSLYQALKMIRSTPGGRQFIRNAKAKSKMLMTPVHETPESLGQEYESRYGALPNLGETNLRENEFIKKLMTPMPEKKPDEYGDEVLQGNTLSRFFDGAGTMPAKPLRKPRPDVESQLRQEADGLMADEEAAKALYPPVSPPMHSRGPNAGWHPPMAMPNTPRDPDKERREKEAMKAFLANGGGPAYGRRKSPMASVPPSQNPFSKPTPTEDEMANAAGSVMQSQIPKAPVQSVQDASFDTPEGFPPNPLDAEPPRVAGPERGPPASPAPAADPVRDRLMALLEANQQSDDSASLMARRNLDDRMSAVSQQNANLDFMKLLMRNAAQMGQIGGKVASTQAFDDNIDSMSKRNSEAEKRYISTLKDSKARLDDRKKTLLALLKMDQDAALRREGFDVEREGNASRNKLTEVELGYQKANAEAQQEISRQGNDIRKNPPARPLTKAEEHELANAEKGLDKYGNPVKGKQEKTDLMPGEIKTDQDFAQEYSDYILKGGKATADANISKLEGVARALLKDSNATGPLINMVPNAARSYFGNKGPQYQADAEAATQNALKGILGGQYTEKEGENVLRRGFDPSQSPSENSRRIMNIVEELKAKRSAKDSAVKFYQKNRSMSGYGGSVSSPSIQSPGQNSGSKTEIKRQYSPSRNQTRIMFSDGSSEVIDGRH